MANIVVVGTQRGDECKGKVVDVITPHVNPPTPTRAK